MKKLLVVAALFVLGAVALAGQAARPPVRCDRTLFVTKDCGREVKLCAELPLDMVVGDMLSLRELTDALTADGYAVSIDGAPPVSLLIGESDEERRFTVESHTRVWNLTGTLRGTLASPDRFNVLREALREAGFTVMEQGSARSEEAGRRSRNE